MARSGDCEDNFFADKEELADNTPVLSRDMTPYAEKVTSEHLFGFLLYSPYLSTYATGLTSGHIKCKKATAEAIAFATDKALRHTTSN